MIAIQDYPLSGWLKDLKNFAGDVITAPVDYAGDKISDAVGLIGRVGGQTVRLAADKDVQAALVRGGAAYASGGASLVAEGSLSNIFGGGGANQGQQGQRVNAASFNMGNVKPEHMMLGVGAIALLALIAKK